MRKGILFVLICSLAVVFTFTCSQAVSAASGGPNNVSIQTQPAQSTPQQTQTVNTANNNQLELAKEQLRGDFYKYLLVIFGTVLGILVTIIILLIGYARWSNKKEYEKAVADANKTLDRIQALSDKAEDHCEKARNYERQAQEKLASIDDLVKAKQKEMNKQAEDNRKEIETIVTEKLKEIEAEAERQRKVSELLSQAIKLHVKEDYEAAANCYKQIVEDCKEETDWAFNNWGLALYELAQKKDGEQADKLFIEACEKFQKAINLKPDYHDAFNNWGIALSNWAKKKDGEKADKRFTQACEKYQKSIELKPDYHKAFNNWGCALLNWSKLKEDKEKEDMLKRSEEKLLKAESIKTGSGSYNLACVYALRGDKETCKQWLEIAQKAGELPTRKHAMEDEDLEIVRDEEWFKKLRFKGE
jgi:tetratricopeptide (TPR) repeat protein